MAKKTMTSPDNTALYNSYFKAKDRFLAYRGPSIGFEQDIIYDFIHSGINLASSHEQEAEHENWLLCELFLRQVYFALLNAIEDPTRSMIFRRVSLDSIYTPLIYLKRFYDQFDYGAQHFASLQQQLQRVQTPLG